MSGLACGSSSGTESFVPITGISVRAESLTSERGCGVGVNQLYKYAVVVKYAGNDTEARRYLASNVYDCFADGSFVALPQDQGSFYELDVLAFSRAGYAAITGDSLETLTARLNSSRATLLADAGTAARDAAEAAIDADLKRLKAIKPTATTTCTAQQVDDVQTLAVCKALR